MKLTYVVAALVGLAAAPALAQSELEQLETLSEAAAQNMEDFFVGRVPELAEVMVDWEWDDEMREVAGCTMDRLREEGGDQAVTDYIAAMEVFSATEITSFDQIASDTPQPFNPDIAMQVATDCRAMEVSMQRMQESGMFDAMMAPGVMQRLMAP
jgi:hypothetical protein